MFCNIACNIRGGSTGLLESLTPLAFPFRLFVLDFLHLLYLESYFLVPFLLLFRPPLLSLAVLTRLVLKVKLLVNITRDLVCCTNSVRTYAITLALFRTVMFSA